MKAIDADAGYQVMDELFSAIEENNYTVTPEMLDKACEKYNSLPACCDIDAISAAVDKLVALCEE